jgi:plasmid stabilization system protein ParE
LNGRVQAENDLFDILDYIGLDNPDAAVERVQKIRTKVSFVKTRANKAMRCLCTPSLDILR